MLMKLLFHVEEATPSPELIRQPSSLRARFYLVETGVLASPGLPDARLSYEQPSADLDPQDVVGVDAGFERWPGTIAGLHSNGELRPVFAPVHVFQPADLNVLGHSDRGYRPR